MAARQIPALPGKRPADRAEIAFSGKAPWLTGRCALATWWWFGQAPSFVCAMSGNAT
jgi:hypothetical protein